MLGSTILGESIDKLVRPAHLWGYAPFEHILVSSMRLDLHNGTLKVNVSMEDFSPQARML